ncbi:MAG: helix-turn-helix domain-containing protein [Clostridia bacterium]|nr:helix-turn-helix domain-containing protein [Clostridia bacterium]
MNTLHSQATDNLIQTILSMDSEEQLYAFFEDVCTINEFKDMAQRFEVALMLDQGMNYQQIAAKTNVSTATISRVSRCLNYGNGGYKCAIEKFKKGEAVE